MRVILRWTCPQEHPGADVRLARFKRVLRAAQRTQAYQPHLRIAGLATLEAIDRVCSVERTLERLPAIDLAEFRGSPAAFESSASVRSTPQAFRSPLEHIPKTAVLMRGFQQTSAVKMVSRNLMQGLKSLEATALAAPVSVLREMAAAIELGQQEVHALKHFIVSFTGGNEGELREEDREQFWRVFQVPVFEQRVGFDGRVVAYECDAHDGLHVMPESAAFEETAETELLMTSLTDLRYPTLRVGTRMAHSIESECCGCGNAAPRLIAARPHLMPPTAAAVV
ncbi:MAG TPA: hypothetical protein VNH83_02610 [Bryobacteraceae bacterium]|nr:hypothetical protein [Bryobacteraceae bacterium]